MPTPTLRIVIRPPDREPYALPLDRLTDHVRAARTLRQMGKLASHFARANAAMDSVETETAKDVDRLVERTEHYHKRRVQAFQKKHEGLDAEIGALAEFERDLEDFDRKNDLGGDGERTDETQNAQQKAATTSSWQPPSDRTFKH